MSMKPIIISNLKDTPRPADSFRKPIFGDWYVEYEKNIRQGGPVQIKGKVIGWDYKFGKPKTRCEEDYSDTCELSKEKFEMWSESGFVPFILLFLLIIEDEDLFNFENLPWDYLDTGLDNLIRCIIPGACACGSPTTALASILRVMTSFRNYPGTRSDLDIYEHGSDLAVAYMIDAQNKFLNHGSSIGGSWLEVRGVLWCLAAKIVTESDPSEKEDQILKPFLEANYHMLKTITELLAKTMFLKSCIDHIQNGTKTYEELWEDEGGHEHAGTMYYIYIRNDEPEKAVADLRSTIRRTYMELIEYCGVKTWADAKVVIRKLQENLNRSVDVNVPALK